MRGTPKSWEPAGAVRLSPHLPLYVAGAASVLAMGLIHFLSRDTTIEYSDEMIAAAELMREATSKTRAFCDSVGIEIDETIDPNRTCLIGPELTPLMTTLGHLDAKRTTTDPTMASLMVHLLERAGVTTGDTIAVGSSASFPALLLATLAASEAMQVHPVVIISLGSSTYGATNPDFNLLHIYELLLRDNVFTVPPAAISLGGGRDVGEEFGQATEDRLLRQISSSEAPFIYDRELVSNVRTRMSVYLGGNGVQRVAAFVNCGGSFANLGTSQLALELKPGINQNVSVPPERQRGVLFEMAAENVPLIHLLFMRGLALRYGLPWDPIPLNDPGEVPLVQNLSEDSRLYWAVGVPYLVLISLLVAVQAHLEWRKEKAPGTDLG